MPVTAGTLRTMEVKLIDAYLRGLQSAPTPIFRRFTQEISMGTKTVEAPILGMIGPLREWIGPRQIERLSRDAYAITAKDYEKTVSVPRTAVDDDNVGVYVPQFSGLALEAALWPDQQVMKKLDSGETDLCYDKLSFFNASHPVGDGTTFSNVSGSGNPAWYLFDTTKSIMPMIWGQRMAPEFVNLWKIDDSNVFWYKEYISGIYARGVADYGFPQFAQKQKSTLDATNYDAAQTAMALRKNAAGETLGVHANLLVIPRALEPSARNLFKVPTLGNGATNPLFNAIEYVVSDRLSNT